MGVGGNEGCEGVEIEFGVEKVLELLLLLLSVEAGLFDRVGRALASARRADAVPLVERLLDVPLAELKLGLELVVDLKLARESVLFDPVFAGFGLAYLAAA